MKTHSWIFSTLVVLGVGLSLYSPFAAGQTKTPASGCNPNGNTFNLAPPVNASLHGQANESVALLPGRGSHGADLVVGAGLDYRQLVFDSGFPNPLYYVQRNNTNCAADFEGPLPGIGGALGIFAPLQGYPQVAADRAHDAFFMAAVYFGGSSDNLAVGILTSSAANLLSPSTCPNGTENNPGLCWPSAGIANEVPLNTFLFNPSITVDQRKKGTGAGDVYVAVAQQNNQGNAQPQITLTACTNGLNCGAPAIISGNDTNALYPSVQVRSDGGITVSYANVVLQNFQIAEYQMRFVNCKPQGAPSPPSCDAPILVTAEKNPGVVLPGDAMSSTDVAFPRHVDRLEGDGKTVTTFFIYDQCAVAIYTGHETGQVYPKTQVVMTSSTDGGHSWSPIVPVSSNTPGQLFLGTIALDESTETVNIAYYSSQNDKLNLRTQVFLAQVPPGQTTVATFNQLTSALYDGPTGWLQFNGDPAACCDYIGVAAAGTGQKGQSRVYVHFMGVAKGRINGQAFPIYTNTLTSFAY
jgi:hypothetical protein